MCQPAAWAESTALHRFDLQQDWAKEWVLVLMPQIGVSCCSYLPTSAVVLQTASDQTCQAQHSYSLRLPPWYSTSTRGYCSRPHSNLAVQEPFVAPATSEVPAFTALWQPVLLLPTQLFLAPEQDKLGGWPHRTAVANTLYANISALILQLTARASWSTQIRTATKWTHRCRRDAEHLQKYAWCM